MVTNIIMQAVQGKVNIFFSKIIYQKILLKHLT